MIPDPRLNTRTRTPESPAEAAAKHAQAAIAHLKAIADAMPLHGPSAQYDELESVRRLIGYWVDKVTNPDN